MAMVTDPVCGTQVEESQAAAQSGHEGPTYYFCSTECREKFEAEPGEYVGSA